MTLERTEPPLHIPPATEAPDPVACDYVDVVRDDTDQPRFRLQPHADGGRPIGAPLVLEREGAEALVGKLEKVLRESQAD